MPRVGGVQAYNSASVGTYSRLKVPNHAIDISLGGQKDAILAAIAQVDLRIGEYSFYPGAEDLPVPLGPYMKTTVWGKARLDTTRKVRALRDLVTVIAAEPRWPWEEPRMCLRCKTVEFHEPGDYQCVVCRDERVH